MSRVRSCNTQPELLVRSLLHKMGYRFRLHRKSLPGSPDIVLPKYRTVIFVHGCFWHRHAGCKHATMPEANASYWKEKFEKNRRRDRSHAKCLREMGWKVVVVWECQTKDTDHLLCFLRKALP